MIVIKIAYLPKEHIDGSNSYKGMIVICGEDKIKYNSNYVAIPIKE